MLIPEPWLIKFIVIIVLTMWAYFTYLEYQTTSSWSSSFSLNKLLACAVYAAFQIIVGMALLIIIGGAVVYLIWG